MGGRCRKTTRRNRKRRPCTRYAHVRGSFVRNGKAGRSRFRFTGRIRRRELKPGGYRLVAVASNATGRSAPKRVGFKIVP